MKLINKDIYPYKILSDEVNDIDGVVLDNCSFNLGNKESIWYPINEIIQYNRDANNSDINIQDGDIDVCNKLKYYNITIDNYNMNNIDNNEWKLDYYNDDLYSGKYNFNVYIKTHFVKYKENVDNNLGYASYGLCIQYKKKNVKNYVCMPLEHYSLLS